MIYKPNPLLYGANEDFFGSFKIVITMKNAVDHEVLSRSVVNAMKRYPYFSTTPERKGNNIVLQSNPRPVPVFNDGRCVVLGTEESNGHLVTFGCEERKIILNASHYIADGMGIVPLLMTVLYLYSSELYGTDGLRPEKINMPDDDVTNEEYEYPFDKISLDTTDSLGISKRVPEDVYSLCCDNADGDELYSYHLRVPQKAMMRIANPSDGSPVSFLSVMMYRALCSLDDENIKPIVAHVQHQYRSVLKAPVSRHSLVSYIPVLFHSRVKEWDVEKQNTAVRGQIIIGSEPESDISAVKRLIDSFPDGDDIELSAKKKAMSDFINNSICRKTFGISYVGKVDWCGLERYMEDVHVYLGEKNTQGMILMEVMTIGEDFSITFMQKGRSRDYVEAFAKQLMDFEIPVRIASEENYTVCDTRIPE